MNAVLGGSTLSSDASTALVISASSPDVAIRVSALKDVLKNAGEIKANGNESFLRDTILARLGEPDSDVAAVVLAEENRSTLEEVLEAQEILRAVELPVRTGDVAYLSVVLPYLTGPFISSHSHLADEVVKTVFWPRLLATKANSKLDNAVYSSLNGSNLVKTHPWLKDVGTAASAEGVERISQVVDTVARNLAALPSQQQLDEAIAFLLEQIAQPEPSHFSLLVAIRFAGKVEKSRRVEFAVTVLAALNVEKQGLDAFTSALATPLFDDAGSLDSTLLQTVFAHPAVAKTARQVQAATIVGVVQAVHPVKEASWTWLSASSSDEPALLAYRTLCSLIYRVAHTGSSTAGSAALATALLSTLFTSLVADDVLSFLASLFTSSSPIELRLSALRDSAVFIDVLSSANEKKAIDWQIVIPALVVALSDSEKKIRVEALKVLEKVRDVAVAKEGTKTGSVYGRDKFYGASSCKQFLPAFAICKSSTDSNSLGG